MPTTAQQYLNQNYPNKEVTEINISGWNEKDWQPKPNWEKLTEELDLSEFPNLEKLNCSYNEITSLDISNCSKLTELKCWENELTEIKFPSSQLKLNTFYAWTNYLTEIDWNIFNPESLTYISISNNDLQEQNIEVFSKFTNLEEPYLGTDIVSRLEERKYNRFHGSLKKLVENCKQLKKIQVEGIGVEEDLKHLPKGLEITSWHRQNEMIAKIIPLERLYVIRNNIQQFLKKWGKEEGYNWYELNYWKNKLNKEIALSRLQNPDDFSKSWWTITGIQWTNRASLIAGGSLVLVGQSDTENPNSQLYTQIGGVIAIASPFVETITSYINDQIYETKQSKWDEFLTDASTFLDNYHELMGILKQFEKSSKLKGKVNKTIGELNEKLEAFLKIYDDDGNKEIDIDELTTEREKLVGDFEKLRELIDSLKKLEEAVVEYRKFSYYEENIKKEDKQQDTKVEHQKDESQQTAVDLDKHFAEKEQLETKIEVNPNQK